MGSGALSPKGALDGLATISNMNVLKRRAMRDQRPVLSSTQGQLPAEVSSQGSSLPTSLILTEPSYVSDYS